jgi:solute carrier family 25, member 39/40
MTDNEVSEDNVMQSLMENSRNDSNRSYNRYKQVVSSSCGAIITALFMTPLDVVKIRLQSQNRMMHKGDCFVYRNGLMDHLCTCFNGPDSWYNRKIPGGRYHGTIDAMYKIIRFEGFTSLWSGLPPTLFMVCKLNIIITFFFLVNTVIDL